MSGFGFLGKLPDHWVATRAKYLLDFVTSGSRGWAEHYSDEGELFFRIANLTRDTIEPKLESIQKVTPPSGSEGERSRIQAGDLLVSITADLGSVCVADSRIAGGYVSQHVSLSRPNRRVATSRWLGYFVLADAAKEQLIGAGYGGTKVQLSLEDIRELIVPTPPLNEQAQIAKFLDYETAKIDALIEKQQQLIALLKEKRQAVISHAVTKGLNPDAPMRDSGVEWLGEVPAHWEILAVRHALKIDNGPRFPINRLERAEMAGPYPYWGPTGVLDHIDHYRYEGNRALIGEDGDHFLKFAVWPMTHWATGKFNVNNHAHVVADGPKCSARWFHYSFLHRDIGGDVIAQGVSRLKLTREGLSKLVLAVPPLEEQKALITHMEPVIAKVETATAAAELQIGLLQERRTALISAAVTGKIEVRNWKAPDD